jgi:hypothetical protein
MSKRSSSASEAIAPGMTGLGISESQYNRFGAKGGTGFAFEDANALTDRLAGRTVDPVGTTNAANGADRIVNGQPIQSKCFSTARQSVMDAFADGGKGTYRYEGQQLEVPKGQGEEAREIMRKQIAAGKLPGVEDPRAAENIIRESKYTYEQASNIAKGGTLDSLIFDVRSGAVVCLYAAGIGATIDLGVKLWNGVALDKALMGMPAAALRTGIMTMGTHVGAAQLMRTRVWRGAHVGIRRGVSALAKPHWGADVVKRVGAIGGGSGGSAVTRASKVLSSSGATAVAATVVATVPDGCRALSGRGSWAQAGKNLVCNAGSVGGGTVGWLAGASAGAAVGSMVPGVGTVVGAFVGGVLGSIGGGTAAGAGTRRMMDRVVKDDGVELIEVVEQLIPAAMDRHVLGDAERAVLRGTIPVVFDTDVLRDMYASHERRTFAGERLEEACLAIVSQRAPLNLGLVLVTNAPSPGVADGESAGAAANDDASQPACKQA